MSHIAERLQAVRLRIQNAAAKAQRDAADVCLLAVSKAFSSDDVARAAAAGQRAFGENYVQEALAKIEALRHLEGLEWHMIGPLQSNKTNVVAAHFHWVHTIDREKIALRLSAARAPAREPLSVCVQVNISGEATKSGVAPGDALALARAVAAMPRVRLRGFMGIAHPDASGDETRAQFRVLRHLLERANDSGLALDTLSMGMSADLEAAIEEGATIVRVGTAIFGERVRAKEIA
jgi:pyridoxal phosphate enzyme (YggS family)